MHKVLRPQDIDQVIFLGQDSIRLMEFWQGYPQPSLDGRSDYYIIKYGEPWFFGMLKRERIATAIEDQRILENTVVIRGKRTLVVLADLDAIDKNRSIVDMATTDLQGKISNLRRKNDYLQSEAMLLNQFIKEKHLESTWEEWLLNKLELLRVAQVKTAGKPEGAPPVSLEIGEQKEKK